MITAINGYSINTYPINAGYVYSHAFNEDEYASVSIKTPFRVSGSLKIEELASVRVSAFRKLAGGIYFLDAVAEVEAPVSRTRWGSFSINTVVDVQDLAARIRWNTFEPEETVTVFFDNDLIQWPATQAIETSIMFTPVIIGRGGSLNTDAVAEVEAPAVHAYTSAITPEELVSVWLRDWSDARERRRGSKMLEVSLLFISAIVKMWSYPVVADAEVLTSSTIKKSFGVDIIDESVGFYSDGDVRSWYYPVEASSDVLVGGTVHKSSISVPVESSVDFGASGNIRMVNASTVKEEVIVNSGETIVLFDGGARLESCGNERLVEDLIPCTPWCPVYP